jgi:CheY-like chemotaxis protein
VRVLVVDDDPAIRQVLRLALSEHHVLEASDGHRALAVLARADVDVVVLDVMMPQMDGITVLRRIRADEALRDLPVVMLTARGSEDDHARAFSAGADAYVTKPFEAEDLCRVVWRARELSPQGRAAAREEALGQATLFRHLEQNFS